MNQIQLQGGFQIDISGLIALYRHTGRLFTDDDAFIFIENGKLLFTHPALPGMMQVSFLRLSGIPEWHPEFCPLPGPWT